jgi:hypothetical protein
MSCGAKAKTLVDALRERATNQDFYEFSHLNLGKLSSAIAPFVIICHQKLSSGGDDRFLSLCHQISPTLSSI